ncbi:MAG: trehalose-phosphatase [Planctomycetota bacterium]
MPMLEPVREPASSALERALPNVGSAGGALDPRRSSMAGCMGTQAASTWCKHPDEVPASLLSAWLSLARHTPLGILLDLDGTLIPFAPTPAEALLPADVAAFLGRVAELPGVRVAVISGRSRESLEQVLLASAHNVLLIAEHGGWFRGEGAWQPLAEPLTESPAAVLAGLLAPVVAQHAGARLERKAWSVAVHFRNVGPREQLVLQVEVASVLQEWLAQHPDFGLAEGAATLEVRPTRIRKAVAATWMRNRAGTGARLLALGDDLTDEDMFAALGPADEAILVGDPPSRPTRARWRLPAPPDAVAFLEWLVRVREEAVTPAPVSLPAPIPGVPRSDQAVSAGPKLLVISNRLPELRAPTSPGDSRRRNVGGLVSALEPILRTRSGLWLGWSGHNTDETELGPIGLDEAAQPPIAWLDFPRRWAVGYYEGFCNRTLWPIFHSLPGRARLDDDAWRCYVEVNDAFANVAARLVGPGAAIWTHDYHLFLAARALRRRGHRGPLGHFLHIPWPGLDMFSILPWAEELLDALLDFDLLGFQTRGHLENFRQCVGALSPARVSDDAVEHRSRRIRIGAFPIGIIPENYQEEAARDPEVAALLEAVAPSRLILGVDRLDYTKGIPARLRAFGRLLETVPEWRGRVSLVQISVPSRADIAEYTEQRAEVEAVVGRINGEFGEGRWVPIRYLYRSYDRQQLVQLYRTADVGLVTPLRDGMNLVAKEFVAAQDPARPGALVLSRFAGAASELGDAVLTNPYHVDGLARDLDAALRLPLEERLTRHARLLANVMQTTAVSWAEGFLETLLSCGPDPQAPRQEAIGAARAS